MGIGPKANAADIWRERIAAQRDSGLSIRAWCRDNGRSEHAFYSWRARLGLRPVAAAARRPAAELAPIGSIAFAEVVMGLPAQPPVASETEPLCLKLSGGRELVLPSSMPIEQVARLVRLVEGQP